MLIPECRLSTGLQAANFDIEPKWIVSKWQDRTWPSPKPMFAVCSKLPRNCPTCHLPPSARVLVSPLMECTNNKSITSPPPSPTICLVYLQHKQHHYGQVVVVVAVLVRIYIFKWPQNVTQPPNTTNITTTNTITRKYTKLDGENMELVDWLG